MKIKQINWTTEGTTQFAVFMGITLAVHLDKDNTYTASLSGIPNQRPEFQKLFTTADKAKEYAVNTLLQREIMKHFIDESDELQKPKGVYSYVWHDMKGGKRADRYVLNVPMYDMNYGRHNPTIKYLCSLGYHHTTSYRRVGDFSYDFMFELR